MHGYSSSSEDSDDSYTRRKQKGLAPPASTNSNDNSKKKKKRRVPPQRTINQIWKKFSNKKFNRALAILPFEPVLPPVDASNELLAAGYERAAEECRRKVKKIIQECRRVNMRYRDPGWDLDWDLKYEKGHTLNGLGRNKFDLTAANLRNPSSTVPKAVKRVREIFDKPTFMDNISASDVKQGGLGDCWLMATFSGLANVPDGIKRLCVEYDERIGIYGFVFYRDGEWIYSIVDDKLFLKSPNWDSPSLQRDLLQQIDREDVERVYRKTYQTGSKALFFAQCIDQNSTWVPLLEKAYAKAHGDFSALIGGWIGEGLEDLSGGVTTELLASDILDLDEFWEKELSRVNDEFLFGCSTGLLDGGYGDRNGISEGHAYIVMEARTLKSGVRLIKLRNPWGKTKKGIWEGAWSDGSKEWTSEVKQELDHQFGNDSVFWISYEDLLQKYQHFDRTRLFREPDWRCCQRWIGVDVPWKACYHEKFHIKLTRESPLVLVLSQLDDRYFKGLEGQYTFRLHFRLHERDRPEAEDYIVRSHGNYLMDRSVSVELPCMLPGNYSIFVSVVGSRYAGQTSIQDVVKRECKNRTHNEKLAQVGYAYDLAHSKATAHLEAVKQSRKKMAQKKASEARIKERQHVWEKRHLNRKITLKQARKNNKKLESRNAAREEKKRVEEEKKKLAEEEEEEEEKKKRTEEEKKRAEGEQKPQEKACQTEEPTKEKEEVKGNSADADEKREEQSKSEEDSSTAESEQTQVQHAAEDDESPEGTPINTPAQTPAYEKTEQQANEMADKQSPGDKASEKPDEKAQGQDGEVASAGSSESSGTPQILTPSSTGSATPSTAGKNEDKVSVPPIDPSTVSGGPPPAPAPAPPAPAVTASKSSSPAPAADKGKAKKDAKRYVTSSEGESSASPVSDWEALYSSDDMTRKPRTVPPPTTAAPSKYRDETDDENDPDPWNAICIVGLRVYSKDEDLELRVVMEGGELEEGGMGEKGEQDLDNAQANAGGARGRRDDGAGTSKEDGEEEGAYEGDSEEDKKKRRKGRSKRRGGDRSGAEDTAGTETEREKDGYAVIVQKTRGGGESEYEDAAGTKDKPESA